MKMRKEYAGKRFEVLVSADRVDLTREADGE